MIISQHSQLCVDGVQAVLGFSISIKCWMPKILNRGIIMPYMGKEESLIELDDE